MGTEGYRGRSELGRRKKKELARGERKKERERPPPERVAGKREEKSAKERQRGRNGWKGASERRERARVDGTGQRGKGREHFLLRPASKMALAAAPLVIKINN